MTVWLEIIAFRPLSLAPPTTPCLARCAFIQLCIQPHPRLIPPPPLLLLFFLRAWPRSDDVFSCETRRRTTTRDETRRAGNSIVPPRYPPSSSSSSAPRRQIWTDAFVSSKNSPAGAGEGETWSLTSLCVGRSGSHGERKAENLHRSDPRVYVFSLLRIGREMIVLCSRFKVLVKTIENLWMSPWPSDPHIFSKSRLSLAWSFGIARRTQSVRERKVQG